MMRIYTGNILLRGVVTDGGIHIVQYNGIATKQFKNFTKSFDGNIFTTKNVAIGMNNLGLGTEVEILTEFKYKERHCYINDEKWYFYKIRKPKCVFGLKKCSILFKRIADECFHKSEV